MSIITIEANTPIQSDVLSHKDGRKLISVEFGDQGITVDPDYLIWKHRPTEGNIITIEMDKITGLTHLTGPAERIRGIVWNIGEIQSRNNPLLNSSINLSVKEKNA